MRRNFNLNTEPDRENKKVIKNQTNKTHERKRKSAYESERKFIYRNKQKQNKSTQIFENERNPERKLKSILRESTKSKKYSVSH